MFISDLSKTKSVPCISFAFSSHRRGCDAQYFMDSASKRSKLMQSFCLCYSFRSLCCSRHHSQSHAVQTSPQSVILACAFYSLTDAVASGVFQRPQELPELQSPEFTHSHTMHDTSQHHVSCPILAAEYKKGSWEIICFCLQFTHIHTYTQSMQANSQ